MKFRSFLTLGILLGSLSSTFGQAITPESKTKVLQTMQASIQRQAFVPGVDFAQWPTFLEKRRSELDKSEDVPAFVNTVNEALRDFGISHIRLFSPQSAKARITGVTQNFGLRTEKSESGLKITALAPKGPAAQLGLEAGDEIIAVEGIEKPTTYPIPSDRETTLLTIKRKSTGLIKNYMVLKKAYSTDQPNTLTWTDKTTAVLRIPSFARTYNVKQIAGFIEEVNAKKAKSLVIDLRGNGGGLVSNCNHLLSLLTPVGTPIGTQVGRQMAERYIQTVGGDGKDMVAIAKWAGPTSKTFKLSQAPYLGKLAILLDKGSASASEISSAVLKEQRGAVLVGKPSAGAVLVSFFVPLRDTEGFEVQVPLSDYVSPGGMRLEKNPLKPDVTVEAVATETSDPVLESALKAIK
ncbi:MAG: S41 family peptidase [Armatimonadetes bacterium]|nr:S41 family peptidase [Armatimonadota bacterium]